MSKYAEESWRKYLEHRSASRLVRCVYHQAVIEADKRGDKRLVPRATEALVRLARLKGRLEFIELKDIAKDAGIETTAGTKGLWPWLKKRNGADVLEERSGPKRFAIKEEFYGAMLGLFPDINAEDTAQGIMRLRGLGKEIWAGIDAQDYVNRERAAWAG